MEISASWFIPQWLYLVPDWWYETHAFTDFCDSVRKSGSPRGSQTSEGDSEIPFWLLFLSSLYMQSRLSGNTCYCTLNWANPLEMCAMIYIIYCCPKFIQKLFWYFWIFCLAGKIKALTAFPEGLIDGQFRMPRPLMKVGLCDVTAPVRVVLKIALASTK